MKVDAYHTWLQTAMQQRLRRKGVSWTSAVSVMPFSTMIDWHRKGNLPDAIVRAVLVLLKEGS